VPTEGLYAEAVSRPGLADSLQRDYRVMLAGPMSLWALLNSRLRPGESITTLANRYGVPEKEILRVNGFKTAAAAKPGQIILIPTLNGGNAAKASAQTADLSKGGHLPQPGKQQEQNVAVVPGANSARDKSVANADPSSKLSAGAGKGPKGTGGTESA